MAYPKDKPFCRRGYALVLMHVFFAEIFLGVFVEGLLTTE
jgi:hypothetical protein